MAYKIHSSSDDCYPGTSCLINKFNIRSEKELSLLEAGITAVKSTELMQHPFSGEFGFDHLKAIHKYLFDDLYEWAGKIRTVNLSKKGTYFGNLYIAPADYVEGTAAYLFTVRLFYELICREETPEEAVSAAASMDEECGLFRLYRA